MGKQLKNGQTECTECAAIPQERLNYFTGQFLAERDFRAEQDYFIGKGRQHNRFLHGWGAVCGLRVTQHPDPDCRNRIVILEPGLALDCCGREIAVPEKIYIDLAKQLAPADEAPSSGDATSPSGQHLLVSLCYSECRTEYVPSLYSECGCPENQCEANRVREGFEVSVQLVDELPESPAAEAAGVNLKWMTTINLAGACRTALDPVEKRLYVLSSPDQDQSQIMVYDAENCCMLRTIPVEGTGADLAIDQSGGFLYVIVKKTGENNWSFLVIDVKNQDSIINTFSLASGSAKPKIAAADDGKVFTLDPNGSQNKVVIWNTGVNTEGKDADPTAVQYATVNTGADPRDIAVSADGLWLFIAECGTAKQITAVKVDTLGLPSPLSIPIQLPAGVNPASLAVSGDGLRLFAATDAKKVHAFNVPQDPVTGTSQFTEIGSGVSVGAVPVDLAASPSGKWAYVLLEDDDHNGWLCAVNAAKLETDPSHAVGEPLQVISYPQNLCASSDGRELYVAGQGAQQQCGGVSVIEVNERACGEIFWKSLDGCPECGDDHCVPLAAVRDYQYNQAINDADIDNRIRPLVPSTETLRRAILCALETGGGNQGPEGPQGPKGADGTPGAAGSKWFYGEGTPAISGAEKDYYLDTDKGDIYTMSGTWIWIGNIKGPQGNGGAIGPAGPGGPAGPAGPGLEEKLTQITALSWKHNTDDNPLAKIVLLDKSELSGVVITFSREVIVYDDVKPKAKRKYIDEHIFQVLTLTTQQQATPFICRWPVKGIVYPVKFDTSSKLWYETEGPAATSVAFCFSAESEKQVLSVNDAWVLLRGDFVMDCEKDSNGRPVPGRAIDAEFVRAQLKTGDRPKGSDFGIQGGLFESWFRIFKMAGISFPIADR